MSYIAWIIVASVLLLPGILLSFLPVPMLLYMFVVAAIFSIVDKFAHISGLELGILAAIAAVAMIIELITGVIGAKWGGAHWSSIWWGALGLIIGLFIIPIPLFGGVIGMILGVLGSELHRTNDIRAARNAAAGSFFGWIVGTGIKIVASVVFLVLFVIFSLN